MLSHKDQNDVLRCIRAIAEGPFLRDKDFSTIVGFKREELMNWLKTEPQVFDGDAIFMAITSMNNLSGYPHRKDKELLEMTGLERSEIRPLLVRFKKDCGLGTSSNYFDDLV